MTEEVVIPTKEELLTPEPEEVVEEVVEFSEAEQEAISKGWKPEGVEGKKNLTAEEFLDREKFYKSIHNLERQNKKLQQDLDNLAKFQNKVREDERKRVIAELTAQKKQALEDSDFSKVIDIDNQLMEQLTTTEKAESAVQPTQVDVNETFSRWVNDNKWYQTDPELREYADTVGVGYANTHPDMAPEQVYEYVSREVKSRFAEKFGGTPTPSNKVSTSSRGGNRPKGGTISAKDLSDEERQIMRTVIRSGALTEEEYLKEYASFSR